MNKIALAFDDLSPLFQHGGTADPPDVLDFSANINPLGPPEGIWRLVDFRAVMARYPDPNCRRLTEALANLHQVDPAQIVVGNGSSELIQIIPRALGSRRVAIVEPTYTEYLRASLLAGVHVEHWLAEPPEFRPKPFDPENADLVWLCNPNNPTSQLWPADSLPSWIEAHPRSTFVVDEAFLPFCAEEPERTLIPAVQRLPNLIVLRSLTKFFALAGLRLGYSISSASVAQQLRRQQPPWSVNGLAQAAGWAALLAGPVYRQQTLDWLQREREPFVRQLAALPWLEVTAPSANFVLGRLTGITAEGLNRQLDERGIQVRDAANFVGLDKHYVRVAVRGAADNRRLIAELGKLFRET